ncbi:TlpA family protein disulfide reductase [Blastococcus sp. SYSU DS0539]
MTTPRDRSAGVLRLRGNPGRRVLAAALTAAALLTGCSTGADAVQVNNGGEFRFVAGTPRGEVIPEAERAAAPEFAGTLLGGGEFSSAELDGDIAVLNFWGSWCAPCRVETPEFQEVYADVRDQGVQFLGLNVKETSDQFALAFVERFGIEFPSIYDPRGEVALAFRDYPATAIPSTVVLDREGRVAAVFTAEVSQEDLRSTLDLLLAEV